MDELSNDLMRGAGGLDALNGGLDGNLSQWAEGEAVRQVADEPEPNDRSRNVARPMPPGALLLVIAAVIVVTILLFVH
jgi:hypothetical protein